MPEDKDEDATRRALTNEDVLPALVLVEPGTALLLGDRPAEDFADCGIHLLEERERHKWSELLNVMSLASGGANAIAQGTRAALSVQGLVRLAPETVAALEGGMTPLTSGGWNLGSLTTGGRIAAQVRWLPATGAQAALALSSVTPALALCAMGFQLMSISKRVDKSIAVIEELEENLRQEQLRECRSMCVEVRNTVTEAYSLRSVDSKMYKKLDDMLRHLRSERDACLDAVSKHYARTADLQSGRRYVLERQDEIYKDICLLAAVQEAKYRADMLCCAHVAQKGKTDEHVRRLETRLGNAEDENGRAAADIQDVLYGLGRRVGLMTELPDKSHPKHGSKNHADIVLENLLSGIERVMGDIGGARFPDLPGAKVVSGEEKDRSHERRVLRWILERDERLWVMSPVRKVTADSPLGIASGMIQWAADATNRSGIVVVTSKRVLFWGSRNKLVVKGSLDHEVPLADVRYTRLTEEEDTLELEVVTGNRGNDLRLSFSSSDREAATRIADILATVMHIPDSEVKEDPLVVEANEELQKVEAPPRTSPVTASRRRGPAEGA